jgi:spermidine/putrescine transport system permease protein
MKRPSIALGLTAAFLYAFLYLPIVVVIVYSFNTARYGAWTGFTLKWYGVLWKNPVALDAVQNTLILGGTSTLIATVLGTMLGFGLMRYRFPGKKLFSWLMYIPVVIPDIVMAVALLLFYRLVRDATGLFNLGMSTMIVSHVTFQIPFVAIVVRSRLAGSDPALEEAARDLGAGPWQTFQHVTLPLMLPGVAAGAMLAFTLSLDDFVVSFFTTGPGATTLPILIYSSVKRGITPDINALSTLIVVASVAATLGAALLQRGPERKGETP